MVIVVTTTDTGVIVCEDRKLDVVVRSNVTVIDRFLFITIETQI